jgi:cytochrome P450
MVEESKQHPLLLYIAAGAFVSFLAYTRLSLYLTRRRIIKENGCKPCPYVYNKEPFLGLDVLLESIKRAKEHTFLEATLDRLKSFGPNVHTFHSRLINYPIILTTEPENVKTILSLKFKDYSFGNRHAAFAPLLGQGIFNSDGERWANSRHLLRPNFAREQVADLSMLERHFRFLIKAVPKDGSTVDLQDLFFRMTIDTATEFLFNHSTDSLRMVGQEDDSNEDAQFAKAFQFAQADAMTRVRFGPLNGLRNNKKGDEAIRICHAYIDKWVDEAIRYREEKDAEKAAGSTKEERYVFIHELAKQTKDKKRIREELINILLAGRDTTASLLSNMFNMISRKPEVWQKLREEVEGLNGRTPSYEELRNFKYLKWCMNECKFEGVFSSRRDVEYLYPFTDQPSPTHPPCRSLKLPPRHPRHRHAPRRRPRRHLPPLRPQRHFNRLLDVRHPPTPRLLRHRRRRVPARALGASATRLGVSPLQRRPAHLSWPTVRVDGSGVRDGAHGAAVCGDAVSG